MGTLEIIDADGHIREEVNEIQEYLRSAFRRAQVFLSTLAWRRQI